VITIVFMKAIFQQSSNAAKHECSKCCLDENNTRLARLQADFSVVPSLFIRLRCAARSKRRRQ
jgi:hypothetical protein